MGRKKLLKATKIEYQNSFEENKQLKEKKKQQRTTKVTAKGRIRETEKILLDWKIRYYRRKR